VIEELKEELKKLKARLDVLEKENIELRTENTKFKDEIKRLSAENTKLKERLNKNSSNSDKPPSTDDFKRRQRNIKKSKRKRGAQPGHKGITRKKVATENITKHIKFHIEDICSCGCKEVVAKQMKPKHQTWELPKIVPNITQYYVESGRCKNCKKRRTAKFPLEVPKGALGRVITQNNHVFASICAVFKLECLKIKYKMNHFALRARLLITATQQAYSHLQKLQSA